MGGAIGRVLAPFLALAAFMFLVGVLAESDLLAGEPRPAETGTATPSTRTTVIELFGPGTADPTGAEGAEAGLDPEAPSAGTVGPQGSLPAAEGGGDGSTATTQGEEQAGGDGSGESGAGDGAAGDQPRTYTVKAGDNPYEIARQFDVTAAELMEFNGIDDPTGLQVGTVLRIPQP
ncbi:MAG: LysM peptidoglycan-binding domain-containing protein [Actinobacteria bacterium]|nr:LysM peptidoglycan-binding domain-containing protein [Actinomycetota bacterium]